MFTEMSPLTQLSGDVFIPKVKSVWVSKYRYNSAHTYSFGGEAIDELYVRCNCEMTNEQTEKFDVTTALKLLPGESGSVADSTLTFSADGKTVTSTSSSAYWWFLVGIIYEKEE